MQRAIRSSRPKSIIAQVPDIHSGYYLSARISHEYIQIQVPNISTSEIEGDVTMGW